MRRRARLLSPFFYPERISTGRYNHHLALALVERGYEVEAVCSHPLYPDWRPHPSNETLPGMTIRRGGAWMRYPRSPILRRLLLEGWFAAHVCASSLSGGSRSDLVVAIFPPNLGSLLGFWLADRNAVKVGVVHDLQGIMARSVDSRLRRWIANAVRRLERRALAACDRLICLSDSMRNVLIDDYGLDPTRCVVAYPFVTLTDSPVAEDRLTPLFPEGMTHVVYAGALGEKQMPDRLEGFFRSVCAANPNVCCHIFSDGPAMTRIRESLERAPEARLICHGLVSDDQLVHLYRYSAVQVIPQARGTGAGAFPSKLPNLFAAGVPVFAICDSDSELAHVLTETGGGMVTGETREEEWPDLLGGLLASLDLEDRETRLARLAPFVERRFSVNGVVDSIIAPICR